MNTRRRDDIYALADKFVNEFDGRPADHFPGNHRYEGALDIAIENNKSLKRAIDDLEARPLYNLSKDLKLIESSSLGIKPSKFYRDASENFKKLQKKSKGKKTKRRRRKTKRRKTKRRKKLIKK